LDFRHINIFLEDEKFEVLLIRVIFRSLAGSGIFSPLNLKIAYLRFQIAKDIHKTVFTWRIVQYAFQGAPFDVKTISSIFQSTMSSLLGDLSFAQVFQDDIIVFSNSYEEHFDHMTEVLSTLNQAELIINRDKCNFFHTEIKPLGFIFHLWVYVLTQIS